MNPKITCRESGNSQPASWKRTALVMVVGLSALFGAAASNAAELADACGPDSTPSGKNFAVDRKADLRKKPAAKAPRIISEKATALLGSPQYSGIDRSTQVKQDCTKGTWSRVRVTEPEWLRETYIGWVPTSSLGRELPADKVVVFTEDDFTFDRKTRPYKEVIVRGVNKVARENANCKKLDPQTAYISEDKSTRSNPVFFVTCGEGLSTTNAYFSKSDVEGEKTLAAIKHMDRRLAISKCEAYAKQTASHPSTVDFSWVMSLFVVEAPNGNTDVSSTFTAKNGHGVESKYNIRCLANAAGLFEPTITPATR